VDTTLQFGHASLVPIAVTLISFGSLMFSVFDLNSWPHFGHVNITAIVVKNGKRIEI
jgi:hypothetical protein